MSKFRVGKKRPWDNVWNLIMGGVMLAAIILGVINGLVSLFTG